MIREKENVDKYYMTEVDRYPNSIYCYHTGMGNHDVEQHQHQKGQFLYTEGGIVFLKTSEKSYFLPARHYIWIPGGVKHSIHPSSSNVIMRNLYFPKFDTDNSFYDKINIYPVNDLLIEMIMYTNRWSGDIHEEDEPQYTVAKAFKLILPEISTSELPLVLPYPNNPILIDIISYLEKDLSKNVTFSEIAKQFNVGERTLARIFQKEINMSFIQYYTILRMLMALKLLLDDKMSVKEVAERVGYHSLPTFSNTFFKIIGVRPSHYVKSKNYL